ncbi:ABC transporter substrate-binding protein [Paraburkholderia sp.]|uniref:ABC transporter substrate-binding protein n=1 Tax=Paraburkholderia sp. TaxID=1926495 RepID=UPI003C7A8381
MNSVKAMCALGAVSVLSLPIGARAAAPDFAAKKVCVNRFASAPVIDNVMTGLKAGIASGPAHSVQMRVENPEADAAAQQTIGQQFVSDKCDVIVAVGTAAAQAAQRTSKSIPVVFVGVSTPVESGLVKSLAAPGANVTGVSDPLPVENEIDAMHSFLPRMKTVGLIYKVGDPAGDSLAGRAKAHLEKLGIKEITAGISNPGETTLAAQSLVGRVDAIEFPCDTTTISGMAGAMKVAKDANLPVFGCTSDAVAKGAILAGSYDYITVGHIAADLITKILSGASPASTAVVVPPITGFDFNKTEADRLGLRTPGGFKAVKTY